MLRIYPRSLVAFFFTVVAHAEQLANFPHAVKPRIGGAGGAAALAPRPSATTTIRNHPAGASDPWWATRRPSAVREHPTEGAFARSPVPDYTAAGSPPAAAAANCSATCIASRPRRGARFADDEASVCMPLPAGDWAAKSLVWTRRGCRGIA